MRKLVIYALLFMSLCSCKERDIDRSKSKLPEKNYTKAPEPECASRVFYGNVYVEFKNLTRTNILSRLRAFNDSILGIPNDTSLYITSGTPWAESASWLSNELFVSYHDNHFGHSVFSQNLEAQRKTIRHGSDNGSTDYYEYDLIRFQYILNICPTQLLESDDEEYHITISRGLVTKQELDSLYASLPIKDHPWTTQRVLSYEIDDYLANISIELTLVDYDDTEYYYLNMQDTIRVYSGGPG